MFIFISVYLVVCFVILAGCLLSIKRDHGQVLVKDLFEGIFYSFMPFLNIAIALVVISTSSYIRNISKKKLF